MNAAASAGRAGMARPLGYFRALVDLIHLSREVIQGREDEDIPRGMAGGMREGGCMPSWPSPQPGHNKLAGWPAIRGWRRFRPSAAASS